MKKDNTTPAAPQLRACGKTGRSLAHQTLRAAAAALAFAAVGNHAAPLANAQTAPTPTASVLLTPTAPAPAPAPARQDAGRGTQDTAVAANAAPTAPAKTPSAPAASAASAPVVRLAPVVVVAARVPEPLALASPSVSIIDAAQLSVAGLNTLSDVLRTEAGFFDLHDSVGQTASVFIRGANSNMALFTLDGRRLNPGFGNFDTNLLTTGNLASVQILRGPSSTHYGANAAAGVVDLRSLNPLDLDANKPVGSIAGEAGTLGYWRGAFDYAAATEVSPTLGKAGISLGGSWTQADNKRVNSDYRTASFLPRLDWQVHKKVTLNLVANFTDAEYGVPGSTDYPSPTDRVAVQSTLVSPSVKVAVTDDIELQAYYSFTRNDYTITSSYPDHNVADGHEATLLASWKINSLVALNGGVTYEERIYERQSTNYGGGLYSTAPWLRIAITPLTGLTLDAAVRYNAFSDYKNAWTGEASARYRLDATGGTTFHARIANSYSVPDIQNVSYYHAPADVLDALSPEKNFAWEIGIKQPIPFLKGGNVSAVFFQNRITDLIQWDADYDYTTWEIIPGSGRAHNIKKARTQGVELSADLRPFETLRLYANATFLKAEDRSSGARLVRRPDATATFGIEHSPTDRLTVGASVTYVHGVEDVSYPAQVDLKPYYYGRLYATVRVWEKLEIYGRIENLFNDHYEPSAGYPALPLRAVVGARVRF